jgi:hypothetical protein
LDTVTAAELGEGVFCFVCILFVCGTERASYGKAAGASERNYWDL